MDWKAALKPSWTVLAILTRANTFGTASSLIKDQKKTSHWTIKQCQKNIKVVCYFVAIYSRKKCKRVMNCPWTKYDSCVAAGDKAVPSSSSWISHGSYWQLCSSESLHTQVTALCPGRKESLLKSPDVHTDTHTPLLKPLRGTPVKTGLLSPAQQQQNSSPLPPCHLPNRCLFWISTKTVSLLRTNSKYLDSTSAGHLMSKACIK